MSRPARHYGSFLAVAAICALVFAGCGNGSKASTNNSAAGGPNGGQFQGGPPGGGQGQPGGGQGAPDPAAMKKLQSCLTKHGAKLPDAGSRPQQGGGNPGNIDQSAMKACSQYLPSGGGPPGAGQ